MVNYTMDCYETKREILNFSKKISDGLNKRMSKFVSDIQYGLSKGKSCLISEISRSLNEEIKLKNTIERLCDNLQSMKKEEVEAIKKNYLNGIKDYFPYEAISIFDDSDISKRYGKKFEDLDKIIDASDPDKKVVNGYHVCEAVILGKNEKQPISVYSEIYSGKSDGFISKNKYTMESIDTVINLLKRKCNMVFDRGYDDNKIIERSRSLKRRIIVWLNQISRGISEILKYAHTVIKEYQRIERREKNKQLEFKL